ncbi:MAG: hypothetical protein AAF628_19895 [Planctomycetota bacterium]
MGPRLARCVTVLLLAVPVQPQQSTRQPAAFVDVVPARDMDVTVRPRAGRGPCRIVFSFACRAAPARVAAARQAVERNWTLGLAACLDLLGRHTTAQLHRAPAELSEGLRDTLSTRLFPDGEAVVHRLTIGLRVLEVDRAEVTARSHGLAAARRDRRRRMLAILRGPGDPVVRVTYALRLLGHPKAQVRMLALETVGAHRGLAEDVVAEPAALLAAVDDRAPPREAVLAVGMLGPRAATAIPRLESLAAGKDRMTAAVARAALRQVRAAPP